MSGRITRSSGGTVVEGLSMEGRAPGAPPRARMVADMNSARPSPTTIGFGTRTRQAFSGFGSRVGQTLKGFGQRVGHAIMALPWKATFKALGSAAVGAGVGAAVGSVVPGLGTVTGAIYGGVSGLLGSNPRIRQYAVDTLQQLREGAATAQSLRSQALGLGETLGQGQEQPTRPSAASNKRGRGGSRR